MKTLFLLAAATPLSMAQESAQAAATFSSVASGLALTQPGVTPANLSLSSFVDHYGVAFSASATQLHELSASVLQEGGDAALSELLSQFAAGCAAVGSDLADKHITSSAGYHNAAAGLASLGGYFYTLSLNAAAAAAYSIAAELATIGGIIDDLEPRLAPAPTPSSRPAVHPVSAWVRAVQKIGSLFPSLATGLLADLDAPDAPGGGGRRLAPLRALQASRARGPVEQAITEPRPSPEPRPTPDVSPKPRPEGSPPPSIITVPPSAAPPLPGPLAAPPSSSPAGSPPPAISPHVCPSSHPFRGCTNYDTTTYTYKSSSPWKRYIGGIDIGIEIRGVGIGTSICPDGGWWIRTNTFTACTTRKCVCACYASGWDRFWAWGGVNLQRWTINLPCMEYKDNEYEWECAGAPPAVAPPPIRRDLSIGSGSTC